jgi:hypothetical protein
MKLDASPLRNNVQKVLDGIKRASVIESERTDEEMKFVDKCIMKIVNLLALGYGEAGTKIVSDLLSKNNYDIIDDENKGEKVMAIFGFIMINQFN